MSVSTETLVAATSSSDATILRWCHRGWIPNQQHRVGSGGQRLFDEDAVLATLVLAAITALSTRPAPLRKAVGEWLTAEPFAIGRLRSADVLIARPDGFVITTTLANVRFVPRLRPVAATAVLPLEPIRAAARAIHKEP